MLAINPCFFRVKLMPRFSQGFLLDSQQITLQGTDISAESTRFLT